MSYINGKNQSESYDLSIILRVVGGGEFLRKCLEQLVQQAQGSSIEIIVPYDRTVSAVDKLKQEFPTVIFSDLGEIGRVAKTPGALHELFDLRTAAGLRVARGKVIALLEDYGFPNPDWCDQVLKAHQLPYAAIGGAVEHKGKSILNWAIYFLDFGRYQLPLKEGPFDYLSDVNIAYKREALLAVKDVWEKSYNEVRTNWTLINQGMILWLRPQIVVWQDRGKLVWLEMVTERFYWGRIFGRNRVEYIKPGQRLAHIVATPILPFVLVWREAFKVFKSRRNRLKFLISLPLMLFLAGFWCLGELAGYVDYRG